MVGEDWLISQFQASEELAQNQVNVIGTLIEQERSRLVANMKNDQTTISHYSQPMMDDGNGRPIMRPTTPLKSSQAHRANTSQITDASHMSYSQQQQPAHPPNPSPFDNLVHKQQEFEASLPDELRPKPKIPRTPLENQQRPGAEGGDGEEGEGQEGEESKDPKMNTEYRQGFLTKEKISRTPPEERRRRAAAKAALNA